MRRPRPTGTQNGAWARARTDAAAAKQKIAASARSNARTVIAWEYPFGASAKPPRRRRPILLGVDETVLAEEADDAEVVIPIDGLSESMLRHPAGKAARRSYPQVGAADRPELRLVE